MILISYNSTDIISTVVHRKTPLTVRLPAGLTFSGPLLLSSGLLSICFKCMLKSYSCLVQLKLSLKLENYGTYKKADFRSSGNQRAHNLVESTTCHDVERYWVDCCIDDAMFSHNYYSALAILECLKKGWTNIVNWKLKT